MTNSWQQTLDNLPDISSSPDLERRVRRGIARDLRSRIALRWLRRVFFGISAASIPAAAVVAYLQASGNGFWTFGRLAFSDPRIVLGEWRSFAVLLAETMPWASLMWFAAGVAATVVSVRWLRRTSGIFATVVSPRIIA